MLLYFIAPKRMGRKYFEDRNDDGDPYMGMEALKIHGRGQEPGTAKPPVLIHSLKNLKAKRNEDKDLTKGVKIKYEDLAKQEEIEDLVKIKNEDRAENKIEESEEVKYACKTCENKAPKRRDFKKHVQSVHDEYEFTCNQRGSEASLSSKLKTHAQPIHE